MIISTSLIDICLAQKLHAISWLNDKIFIHEKNGLVTTVPGHKVINPNKKWSEVKAGKDFVLGISFGRTADERKVEIVSLSSSLAKEFSLENFNIKLNKIIGVENLAMRSLYHMHNSNAFCALNDYGSLFCFSVQLELSGHVAAFKKLKLPNGHFPTQVAVASFNESIQLDSNNYAVCYIEQSQKLYCQTKSYDSGVAKLDDLGLPPVEYQAKGIRFVKVWGGVGKFMALDTEMKLYEWGSEKPRQIISFLSANISNGEYISEFLVHSLEFNDVICGKIKKTDGYLIRCQSLVSLNKYSEKFLSREENVALHFHDVVADHSHNITLIATDLNGEKVLFTLPKLDY
jgi:hypothetical protein